MFKIMLLVGILSANPNYPNFDTSMRNINILGPQVLSSLSKYVDMSCRDIRVKNDICLIPSVYLDYLKSAEFLKEKSNSEIKDLYLPEDPSSLDYKATNWNLGPFTPKSVHAEIIQHIFQLELAKHILSILVDKFNKQIISSTNSPMSARIMELPILLSWLNGSSKITQYYYFSKNQSCLSNQKWCQEWKSNNLNAIYSVRAEMNESLSHASQLLKINRTEPWEEAELLQQVFELDQYMVGIKSLSLEKALLIRSGKLSSSFSNYIKKVMNMTSMPKMLADANMVNLYRQIILLGEIQRIPVKSATSNQSNDLQELFQESVSFTVNTINEFYTERENEIASGL